MKNILLFCGGKSAEHEISIRSAKSILNVLDRKKYNVLIVGISRSGTWHLIDEGQLANTTSIEYAESSVCGLLNHKDGAYLVMPDKQTKIDFALGVLHGTYGEDGTIQGLLEMYNLPYFGSNVLATAIAMDKDKLRRLIGGQSIPMVEYLAITKFKEITYQEVCASLKANTLFVKPNALGSSIGVQKVRNETDFKQAVSYAFTFDDVVLVERAVSSPRELECAIMGDQDDLLASAIGEIIPNYDFYSYEAKYLDPNGADLVIPARIDSALKLRIQDYSKAIFKAIGCSGLARVDFLLSDSNELFFNEINSLPGFTSISMYPKLMEVSGISYPELVDRLIEYGFKAHARKNKLKLWPDEIDAFEAKKNKGIVANL